jgi:phosphoribosylformylglycinamidine synthase
VLNAAGNVLGLMPHPERVADTSLDRTDGIGLFQSLMEAA